MPEPRCACRYFSHLINLCDRLQEFLALPRPREVGGGSRPQKRWHDGQRTAESRAQKQERIHGSPSNPP